MQGQGWSSHETELMVRYLLGTDGLWAKAMTVARSRTDNPHAVADTLHEELVPRSELRALLKAGWDPSRVNWLEIAHELIERAPDPTSKGLARRHVHRLDLAGTCTGPGPCVTSPIGTGKNWVTKTDPISGLHPYIRAIAHALLRSGHSEQDSVRLAVGIVKRWAAGEGKVTGPTRARAAKAVSQWESLKAKDHAHLARSRDNLWPEGFPGVRVPQTIDLAAKGGAAKFAARVMPTKAHVRAAMKRASKWSDDKPQKKAALAMARLRGKQLGMDPKEYTPPTGAGKGQLFSRISRAFNFGQRHPDQAKMKSLEAKGQALAPASGSDRPRYQITDRSDLARAIKAVGRGSGGHALIRAYIKRRAAALGASDMIPSDWRTA